MTYYTKCSKCGGEKFTNPKLYESRKAKFQDAKEVVKGNKTILEASEYICKDCREETE